MAAVHGWSTHFIEEETEGSEKMHHSSKMETVKYNTAAFRATLRHSNGSRHVSYSRGDLWQMKKKSAAEKWRLRSIILQRPVLTHGNWVSCVLHKRKLRAFKKKKVRHSVGAKWRLWACHVAMSRGETEQQAKITSACVI